MDPYFPFLHHFDEPDRPSLIAHYVRVRGWVIFPEGARVAGPFVEHGERTALTFCRRRDVEEHFRTDHVVGFDGLVTLVEDTECSLVAVVDDVTYRVAIPISVDASVTKQFWIDKAEKLRRIEPLLRCPRPRRRGRACGGRLSHRGDALRCRRCRHRFAASDLMYDFLEEEIQQTLQIDMEHISESRYDDVAAGLIEEFRDGLVLDNGAGLRWQYHPNVVNFEIVDYPTTDVRGLGERLPFASDSFDAVLSIVVLEHVRDPFRCAAEITRVVRPGGKIYVTVPFLQPYHGFPTHFYNMTRQGLEELFADAFHIERSFVPYYGEPIATLTWFLRSWLAGLPEPVADDLREMKIKDLLGWHHDYFDEPFVRELADTTITELASVNSILATKR